MRWVLLAASAIVAASLWLPLEAAEPAAPSAGEEMITFEQYRDWRMHFIERRQTQLDMQLSAADLPARQKTRLEQVKAYYDRHIALDIPNIPAMMWPIKEIGHGKPRS